VRINGRRDGPLTNSAIVIPMPMLFSLLGHGLSLSTMMVQYVENSEVSFA